MPLLSLVIPTLNEEKALPQTLVQVREAAPNAEIVVVDGGSTDGTPAVVEQFRETTMQPVQWIVAERGRGRQMNAGAAVANGDILLFLHADTWLPVGAEETIVQALQVRDVVGGNFAIAFSPHSRLSNFYAFCYNLRSYMRVFYGDSALFVRREIFQQMGGYRATCLMEDVEFIGRLRRVGKLTYLRHLTVVTSSRRFHGRRNGIRMLFVWMLLHVLLAFGVSEETLERLYPPAR